MMKSLPNILPQRWKTKNPTFLAAVKDVARACGMTQLAKDTRLGRESLYKALAPGAKPRYDTLLKVVRALGVTLQAKATNH